MLSQAEAVRSGLHNSLDFWARTEKDSEELASDVTHLIGEPDRLERQAARMLSEGGVAMRPLEAATLEVLREEGAPVTDWAGWVLTGDPE